MKTKPEVPDDLTIEQKRVLVEWVTTESRFDRRYRQFCNPAALRHVVGESLDYHRATGNKSGYKDWLAVIKNRLRSLATEGEFWQKRRPEREQPEMPAEAAPVDTGFGELLPIDNIIDMLSKRSKRA